MYFAAKFNSPVTMDEADAIQKWSIIKETGWTLEYVESLPLSAIWEFNSIKDGKAKARDK